MRVVKGAAAACLLGTATYLGGGLVISWWLNRFPGYMRRRFTFSPWELQVSAENVRFHADDGVGLNGWFLPPAEPDAPVILSLIHNLTLPTTSRV
jgi:hypothetical protein